MYTISYIMQYIKSPDLDVRPLMLKMFVFLTKEWHMGELVRLQYLFTSKNMPALNHELEGERNILKNTTKSHVGNVSS